MICNSTGKPFACGRCVGCTQKRSNSWAFRCAQQYELAHSSSWITLTYDPGHMPVTPNGLYTLDKKAVPLFLKRLRKAQFGNKGGDIKYLAAGEYGGKRGRPHYHVLLFNADDSLYHDAWGQGDVWIDPRPFSPDSVGYTVGYSMKNKSVFAPRNVTQQHHMPFDPRRGLKVPVRIPLGMDDRQAEFHLFSKGLGLNYLTPQIVDWHLADYTRNYVVMPGGRKSALPRYFADRLYTNTCDVAAKVPVRELQELPMLEQMEKSVKRSQDAHILAYGDLSDWYRASGEGRRQGLLNYQRRAKTRNDF